MFPRVFCFLGKTPTPWAQMLPGNSRVLPKNPHYKQPFILLLVHSWVSLPSLNVYLDSTEHMQDSERITIPTVFHNELEELTVYCLMPVYLHLQYWQNIVVSVVSCQSNTSTVVPLISQIQAKHTQMSSRVSDIQPIPSMACENGFLLWLRVFWRFWGFNRSQGYLRPCLILVGKKESFSTNLDLRNTGFLWSSCALLCFQGIIKLIWLL